MNEIEYSEKFEYLANYIMRNNIALHTITRPPTSKRLKGKLKGERDAFDEWVKGMAIEQDKEDKREAAEGRNYNARPEDVNCIYSSGKQPAIKIGQLTFWEKYADNRFHLALFQACYDFVKSVDISESLFEF